MRSKLLAQITIISSIIIALGGVVAIAQPKLQTPTAQQQEESPRHHRGKRGGLLKDLNLSPQQMQQVKQIQSQSKEKMMQKRQALEKAQQELRTLMASDAQKEQIRTKYRELKTLREELADIQFENSLNIRDVLNPEQRQKFSERMHRQHRFRK